MIYTLDTPFREYILALVARNACQEAIDWCEKVNKKKDLTFGEAIKLFLKDKSAKSGWATWNLMEFKIEFDSNVRKGFIEKIDDPMTAFQLLRESAHFSKEEDNILKSKFVGKLPVAEKELSDRKIERVKI